MALKVTRMAYRGIPETQCDEYVSHQLSDAREEEIIRKLACDVVSDFRKLIQEYQVCPVKMNSMIPLPLDTLVGRELRTDKEFLRWLVNRDTGLHTIWDVS